MLWILTLALATVLQRTHQFRPSDHRSHLCFLIPSICLAVALAFPILIGAGPSVAGPLENAQSAYDNKDYSTALGLWSPLAEQGNAEAQRGMGILYDNGLTVTRDRREATDWFRKAASQGDAEAEYRLGMRFVSGAAGLPHDIPQGLAWMTKAGAQGHVISLYFLGELYRTGIHGVSKDISQSIAWHRKAADLGYDLSQIRLGVTYLHGLGVPKDIDQAIFWFRKAADQGNNLAQLILGRTYEEGQEIETNKVAALCWYKKVLEKDGDLKAEAEKAVERLKKQLPDDRTAERCE